MVRFVQQSDVQYGREEGHLIYEHVYSMAQGFPKPDEEAFVEKWLGLFAQSEPVL